LDYSQERWERVAICTILPSSGVSPDNVIINEIVVMTRLIPMSLITRGFNCHWYPVT
jgi:hypothetical protein